jgi:enoyl-CoA hydratase/carnithine racemase
VPTEPAPGEDGVLHLDLAAGPGDVLDAVRRSLVAPGLRCLVVRLGPSEEGWSDDALLALADAAVPVVAALDGAVGGLPAAACLTADLRVAATDARLHVPALRGGTSATLPALLGAAAAQELLLLPRTLTADEALGRGLVHAVAADASTEASRLAVAVAQEPGTGAAVRRSLRRACGREELARVVQDEARLRQVAAMHRGSGR